MAGKSPNAVDRHVGARVRMRRMMLSMSQERLGDALGLTFQQVQKYEKGTNRIGASRMAQMCNVLDVEVGFFFEGAPGMGGKKRDHDLAGGPGIITDFFATPHGAELAQAFVQIEDPADRRLIVGVTKALSRSAS